MKIPGLFLLAALTALGSPALHYEPEEVTLHGVIHRQTFPGSPNYEDISKGDKAETYWILDLNGPVDVLGRKDSDPDDVTERGVRSMQLVFGVLSKKSYLDYPDFVGQRVTVVGQLFHQITAHHKTSVLILVRAMQKEPIRTSIMTATPASQSLGP